MVLEFTGIGIFSIILGKLLFAVKNFENTYEAQTINKKEDLKTWIYLRENSRLDGVDFRMEEKINHYFLMEWGFNYQKALEYGGYFNHLTSNQQKNVE